MRGARLSRDWLLLAGFFGALTVFCPTLPAQSVIMFSNPSFEGMPQGNVPPEPWYNCQRNRDMWSTADTQPGVFGVTTPPSDGKAYVSMVCRQDGSNEGVYQQLPDPLRPRVSHTFRIDMAYSAGDPREPRRPARLRVWGAAADCQRTELLWQSGQIGHEEWRTYTVRFTPTLTAAAILLEVFFDGPQAYDGRLLVDNLSPIYYADLLPERLAVCHDDSASVGSSLEADTYRWANGSANRMVTLTKAGTYPLTVVKNGWEFTDTLQVAFQECPERFVIPNVFTPDGNGYNETFEIRGFEQGRWRLTVFDRWGAKVYESLAYNDDWRGEGLPTGSYFYWLDSKDGNRQFKGWVQILR
jgi:gliding motility-associated-like protein